MGFSHDIELWYKKCFWPYYGGKSPTLLSSFYKIELLILYMQLYVPVIIKWSSGSLSIHLDMGLG